MFVKIEFIDDEKFENDFFFFNFVKMLLLTTIMKLVYHFIPGKEMIGNIYLLAKN